MVNEHPTPTARQLILAAMESCSGAVVATGSKLQAAKRAAQLGWFTRLTSNRFQLTEEGRLEGIRSLSNAPYVLSPRPSEVMVYRSHPACILVVRAVEGPRVFGPLLQVCQPCLAHGIRPGIAQDMHLLDRLRRATIQEKAPLLVPLPPPEPLPPAPEPDHEPKVKVLRGAGVGLVGKLRAVRLDNQTCRVYTPELGSMVLPIGWCEPLI